MEELLDSFESTAQQVFFNLLPDSADDIKITSIEATGNKYRLNAGTLEDKEIFSLHLKGPLDDDDEIDKSINKNMLLKAINKHIKNRW